MGKNFYITFSLLLASISLVSCGGDFFNAKADPVYDYKDFENYKICHENVFFQAKSQYFVYIYSLRCGHCLAIKQDVLSYILECKTPMYLLEYNENIKIASNVTNTIGINNIEELYILGTPTLLKIEDKILTLNVAGQDEVIEILKNS